MWWPRVFSFIFLLLNYCVAKENPIYQVSGIELLDLIRGFKPRDGMLKLTKVEGDRSSLPDGIYFVPEDDALSPPGEDKYLHINGEGKMESRRAIRNVLYIKTKKPIQPR